MLSAIVLAAGLSQRMGEANKLLLDYKNKTVLEATLSNILAAGIQDIIVITGHEAERVEATIKHLPVKVIYNPYYAKGMTTSIQQGIKQSTANGYMICLSDMLMITPKEYILLKDTFQKEVKLNTKCICLPRYNSEKGNPVIFSSWYKESILQHEDMEGCKAIVQASKENIVWVNMPTNHVLMDMDYPEDYEKLKRTS